MRKALLIAVLAVAGCIAKPPAHLHDTPNAATAGLFKPLASVRLSADDDVACLSSALETGDPATGPSTWILKAPVGCVVPWHSHTAAEQLIVVEGEVVAEMTDHPAAVLGPGGFAMMPGRMAHQFTCQGRAGCLMFVLFDRPYDIKWGKSP